MIERIKNNKGAVCSLICALLMIVLLVMQFVPYWQYGEAGESCSISGYVWFPSDHKALESWLSGQIEDYNLNSFVLTPVLVLLLSALGAVLCLIKPEQGWTSLLATACGAAGTIGYLTVTALRVGAGWMWHVLICIALLVLGIVALVQWIKGFGAD